MTNCLSISTCYRLIPQLSQEAQLPQKNSTSSMHLLLQLHQKFVAQPTMQDDRYKI